MYTEYIYENKKYEVALRDLKATLFDIVTTENSNMEELRQKAAQTRNADHQKKLEELCARQEGCLRDVLSLTSQVEAALQRVDTCSRDLKQIEDQNVAQMIAYVHGEDVPVQEDTVSQEPISDDFYEDEEDEVVLDATIGADESVATSGDAMIGVAPAVGEIVPTIPVIRDEGDSQAIEAEKAALLNVSETPGDGVAPVEGAIVEVPAASGLEEVVMTYDDNLSTVANEEAIVEVQSDAVPLIVPTGENATTDVVSFDSSSSAEKKDEPKRLILPIILDPSIIPESATTTEPAQSQGSIPAIVETTTVSDAPVVESVQGAIENPAEPVMVPTGESILETITFKKRSADPPKVIMISGKQAAKLKGSLPTQEALLSAKGMFGSKDGEVTASDLVDSAMSDKQAQIEAMMQQANQLYAEGKVEEAQNMYNQISALNKELQEESVGITK